LNDSELQVVALDSLVEQAPAALVRLSPSRPSSENTAILLTTRSECSLATATGNTSPPSPMTEYKIREPYPIPSENPASQYTLLKNVGKSSFSTVYKAMHNDTKKIVAIKQIGIVQLSFSLCL
jgi:serine/threonine protein kinase